MNAFQRWLMEGPVETQPAMQVGSNAPDSQLGFQTSSPSGMFNTFVRWYDFHHGNWNEVVQAARQNPGLARFIATIEQAYSTNKTLHPTITFKGKTITGMGDLAKIIAFNTERIFPYHNKLNKTIKNPAVNSGPDYGGPLGTTASSRRMGSDSPTAAHVSNQVAHSGHNILPFLQAVEKRLRDLEAKIGVESGPEYFGKA